MRVIWQRRALRQFFAIHDYIATNDPVAAGQIVLEIEAAIERLIAFPFLGRTGDIVGIRLLQIPGRPYVLPYRIVDDAIEITAVFDQRRDPEDRL